MFRSQFARRLIQISMISLVLNACYHPPYNNFKPYNRIYKDAAIGAGAGTVIGAAAGTTLIGTGIGAVGFTARGLYKDSKANIIYELQKKGDISFYQYGDTMTLIVPTDRYFLFNSPRLNEICYPALVRIVRLLKFYPDRVIYVAGFTDNIGSRYHKKMLSQAQAETMITFLWANGIQARLLNAEGYGDKHDVSENSIIHGSAQNRRLEIQWINNSAPRPEPRIYSVYTK